MAIPKFDELFTEVLSVLKSDGTLHRRDLIDRVVDLMELTGDERLATFASGTNISQNRAHWSLEFLCQAGAVERPKRGYAAITPLGESLLAAASPKVTLAHLKETEGMKAWDERSRQKARNRKGGSEVDPAAPDGLQSESTPEERIQDAMEEIEDFMASEILRRIKDERPEFLERTVLRLLHKMGYGSSEDDLEHLGGSGDGGVDGVINQDSLGLDQIYIQAKRYSDGVVGRPQIQGFVGALAGKHASRGIFITTSSFSREARDFVDGIREVRVVLIDGESLARLMISHKVGVTTVKSLEIPGIDENFFESI